MKFQIGNQEFAHTTPLYCVHSVLRVTCDEGKSVKPFKMARCSGVGSITEQGGFMRWWTRLMVRRSVTVASVGFGIPFVIARESVREESDGERLVLMCATYMHMYTRMLCVMLTRYHLGCMHTRSRRSIRW